MIRLMQLCLIIFHCNITFLLFRLSQGSVATLVRWGGWSSYHCMYCSSLIVTVKTVLKSVHEVTNKNKLAPFFTAHGVYTVKPRPSGAKRLRTHGHDFELPAIKYEFNKQIFIVYLFLITCFVHVYYLHFIVLYTCANAICIELLLTYLLTYLLTFVIKHS